MPRWDDNKGSDPSILMLFHYINVLCLNELLVLVKIGKVQGLQDNYDTDDAEKYYNGRPKKWQKTMTMTVMVTFRVNWIFS